MINSIFDFSLLLALFALIAYLLGSFSSAVVICHLFGLRDPRKVGSRNPGASNVLRHGSKMAATLTLFLDIMKGMAAVVFASQWTHETVILATAAIGALMGHLYPLYFNFKGGKGVATGFGAITILSWVTGILALLTWIITLLIFRYSSLSALCAVLVTPIYMYIVTNDWIYTIAACIICTLIVWRHNPNIRHLLNGSENKIWEN